MLLRYGSGALRSLPASVPSGRADYQSSDGETRVRCGDVDEDGFDELVVGFMRDGSHELQVIDDAREALVPMGEGSGFVTAADTNQVWIPSPNR